ncbi:HpcH/HpaI aldolase family protein [Tranquillimonas rosea]
MRNDMKNGLRRRVMAGETVTAAWLELGSPEVAEIMVRSGWDVLVIDCEHGAVGLEDGLNLIRAVEAAGGEAMIRVPDAREATLKRALDRGARSLLVPMVNSAEMAREVAGFCRYAPMGRRGYAAPIVRASGYGAWTDYAAQANEEVFVAVQIEHVDVIPDIAEIAAIPGIDMGFIGPNDLAGSMDRLERLDDPAVVEAITGIEATAAAHGLTLGTIEGQRDYGALAKAGYRLVIGPNDVMLLSGAARAAAERRSGLV